MREELRQGEIIIDPTWMSKTGGFARDKTLRDEFAMRAMQADLTGYDGSYWARVAKHAYEMADAMLEAREAK
jgi:hypothetical protein